MLGISYQIVEAMSNKDQLFEFRQAFGQGYLRLGQAGNPHFDRREGK